LNSPSQFHTNKAINSDSEDIPPAVYDELIAWSVKLNSGMTSADDMQQLLNWRAQDPMHEAAWKKLNDIEQSLDKLPVASKLIATEVLTIADKRRSAVSTRRRTLKLLGLALISITGSALVANQYAPWQQQAYYVTNIGKRGKVVLADGTQMTMNTNTKVDVKFSLFQREIELHHGEIYIETSRDSDAPIGRRSFWVKTEHTALEAIGTKFSVNQQATTTKLHMTQGVVAIHAGRNVPVRAYANESYAMHDANSAPVKINISGQPLNMDPMAWLNGALVVKQMRLDEFVAELSRYQDISLICEADAANITVSGVFQLNQPEPVWRALNAISRTLPVSIVKQNGVVVISKK